MILFFSIEVSQVRTQLFYDSKGNLCKIDSLKWNVFSDSAEIDYQQPEVYAQNLQITEYSS